MLPCVSRTSYPQLLRLAPCKCAVFTQTNASPRSQHLHNMNSRPVFSALRAARKPAALPSRVVPRTFSTTTRRLETSTALPARKPVGAFRGGSVLCLLLILRLSFADKDDRRSLQQAVSLDSSSDRSLPESRFTTMSYKSTGWQMSC